MPPFCLEFVLRDSVAEGSGDGAEEEEEVAEGRMEKNNQIGHIQSCRRVGKGCKRSTL